MMDVLVLRILIIVVMLNVLLSCQVVLMFLVSYVQSLIKPNVNSKLTTVSGIHLITSVINKLFVVLQLLFSVVSGLIVVAGLSPLVQPLTVQVLKIVLLRNAFYRLVAAYSHIHNQMTEVS